MTDWYVWVFYFDDHFLDVYKRPGDQEGGRAHLQRLPLFMPLDLADTPPEPANPVERGLADLWYRTVPSKTPAWRRRFFVRRTKHLLDESDVGAAQHQRDAGRQPDRVHRDAPQGRRRAVVGAPRRARELRRGARSRSPPAARCACCKDTFADAVHLRNDLFSYEREVKDEGELSNCVLVLERFLDITRSRPPTSRTRS